MLKLFIYTVKQLLRDKEALFWTLVFPIIFILIFSLFNFEGGVDARILVIDKSNNEISNQVVQALAGVEGVGINQNDIALDEAKRALEKSEKYEFMFDDDESKELNPNVVLFIPEGYGTNNYKLELYYNQTEEGQVSPSGIVTSIVSDITDGIAIQMANAQNPFEIERKGVSVNDISYFDKLVPGIIGMSIMQSGVIGMATTIAMLKERKILKRLSATPLPIWKFLSTQVLTHVLITVVQISIMLVLSILVLHANVYGSIPLIFVIGITSSFVFLTLGFIAAAITNSANAASSVSSVLTTPMMFLSGVFFDRETLPAFVKIVADYLPLSPVLDAMRKVSLQEASVSQLGSEFLIIGIWTIVAFLIAAKVFKFREE